MLITIANDEISTLHCVQDEEFPPEFCHDCDNNLDANGQCTDCGWDDGGITAYWMTANTVVKG
jgi:hypothetical protein